MRITLNLATRPFADLGPAMKRLRIGMGVLALLAILLGIGLHAIHQKAEAARARDHSLDGQIALIARERQSYTDLMHQPDNAQVLKQAAALNTMFDDKAFSWTLAMEDLETVLPGGVQVTTLEPARQKDGHITLHLQVLGPRDKAVFLVSNLEHSRRFLFPRIVGENAESSDRPGQHLEPVSASNRVQFDVLAEYNPALAGERKAARKPASKSEDSKESATHTPRSIRPVPAPVVAPGRPPYSGTSTPPPMNAQPMRRRAVAPYAGNTPTPTPPPGGPQ
jgi:type IV pilus assembly protein PilN